MKVNFLICGVQKGGTTALATYLKSHPQVCMPKKKEIHFFDNEKNFKGSVDYDKYHNNFIISDERAIGEATPIYMYWHDAMRRIYEYNSDMKIIVILRNPIVRAYSQWNMDRSRGNETLSFYDAIKNERHRAKSALPFQHRTFSYLDRGFYTEQIRRIYRFFDEDNVLVLRNEELKDNPNSTLLKVTEFLSVSPFEETLEKKEIHSIGYTKPMGEKEWDYLSSLFYNEIKSLENLLGWNCADWLKR